MVGGDRAWQFGVFNKIESELGVKAMHREVAFWIGALIAD
jgi:hypothetical protein